MDTTDFARIRFITARYADLQGLRRMLLNAFFVCLALGPMPRRLGPLPLMAFWIFANVADELLKRFYTRRFGSVPVRFWRTDKTVWLMLLMVAVFLEPKNGGGPSTVVVAIGLASLHVVVRDWPWRGYHLLTTVVCGVLTAMRLPLSEVSFVIALSADAAAAWLDHRLLVKTLPPHLEACSDEPATQRESA